MQDVIFIGFYLAAAVVLVLHFTGWLADRNLEWIVFILAAMVFPVVYFTA